MIRCKVLWLWFLIVAQGSAICLAQDQSPAALIRLLTSEPPLRSDFLIDNCPSLTSGELEGISKDRAAAQSLVKFGSPAIPELEQALNSLAGEHGSTRNAWLLLHAYARIRGASAAPQLLRLRGNDLDYAVADSMSLALGLTGYVFDSLPLVESHICRTPVPRDAMSQFILAWEQDNRAWLESHLGPHANVSLNMLLNGRTWEAMRAGLWRGEFPKDIAVGYRLEGKAEWAEPEEPLAEQPLAPPQFGKPVEPADPDLDVLFKNRTGTTCGRHHVKFRGNGQAEYMIDEPDLEGLFRLIASCAADADSEVPR